MDNIGNLNLELLIGAINDTASISITDLDGNIVFANDKFIKLCKYSRDELMGSNHSILNSGYHDNNFWDIFYTSIEKRGYWRGEVKNRAKDGTYYWVDSVVTVIKDDKGKVINHLSIRFNISDKKNLLEENLDEFREDLRKHTFFISHSINATLARLKGLLQIFLLADDDDGRSEILSHIKTTTSEIDGLVKEINTIIDDNMDLIDNAKSNKCP